MISITGLNFGYRSGDLILTDLSAEFKPGESAALVGRSGSGKSTLLYLIGQLIAPSNGSIKVAGVETVKLADWQRAEIRAKSMGFVFQDALLDPARSVLENVLEGTLYNDHEANTEQALELLKSFEVTVDPHRRPGQISGGQAQRVALCRALIANPAIILADEPTGNLDDETASLVWQILSDRARKGATVIVATHDRNRAQTCDWVLEVSAHATAH